MIDEKKLIKELEFRIRDYENIISKCPNIGTVKDNGKLGRKLECENILSFVKNQTKVGEWISCSERMPEETGEYLCTVEWYGSSDKENLISSNIEIPRRVMMVHFLASNKSFKESINFCNYKVLAWIPLMETYKGE